MLGRCSTLQIPESAPDVVAKRRTPRPSKMGRSVVPGSGLGADEQADCVPVRCEFAVAGEHSGDALQCGGINSANMKRAFSYPGQQRDCPAPHLGVGLAGIAEPHLVHTVGKFSVALPRPRRVRRFTGSLQVVADVRMRVLGDPAWFLARLEQRSQAPRDGSAIGDSHVPGIGVPPALLGHQVSLLVLFGFPYPAAGASSLRFMGFTDAARDKTQAKVAEVEAQVADLKAELSKAKTELQGAEALDGAVDTVTSPEKIQVVAQPLRDRTDSMVAAAKAKVARIQAELTTAEARLNTYSAAKDAIDSLTATDRG